MGHDSNIRSELQEKEFFESIYNHYKLLMYQTARRYADTFILEWLRHRPDVYALSYDRTWCGVTLRSCIKFEYIKREP